MTPFSAAHLLTLLKTSRAEGLFGTKEQRSKWDREQRAYWEALQKAAVKLQRERAGGVMYPTEEEFEHEKELEREREERDYWTGVIACAVPAEPSREAGEGIESADPMPSKREGKLQGLWGLAPPKDDPPGLRGACGTD